VGTIQDDQAAWVAIVGAARHRCCVQGLLSTAASRFFAEAPRQDARKGFPSGNVWY
jgi:hypothetical protein